VALFLNVDIAGRGGNGVAMQAMMLSQGEVAVIVVITAVVVFFVARRSKKKRG